MLETFAPAARLLRKKGTLVLWLLATAAALLAVFFGVQQVARQYLREDAERTAVAWARYVGKAVPDVERVFAGEMPSPAMVAAMETLRGASTLFRYKFFAADGRYLLVSDSFTTRPPADAGGGFSHPTAATVALGGGNDVALKEGDGIKRPPLYSEAYVPMLRDGKLIGVVEVYIDQTARAATIAQAFRRVVLLAGATLGAVFALGAWLWWRRVRQEREAEERVRYLAHHDVLTGAVNRASFELALKQASWRRTQGGPGFAVLCVDLDHFKDTNDSLGHAAGDELLRQATARLRALVRSADVVARLGGDEFALLQSGVDGSEAVATLAQRVVDSLAEPYALMGQRAAGSASVGAAIQGIDGDAAEVLMHRADLALYRAKSKGRGCYSFYDAALDRELQDRRALTQDLHDALAQGSLVLHFQPVYDGAGHQLRGYEALTRWPHPTRGFVPPLEFVPLAEETGLIDELGRWVLRTACAEAAGWPDGLSVAVNLSPSQFKREGVIVEEIRDALAAAGLPAQRLEVEITESLLMNNTEPVLRMLNALHTMGVRIAMDDFGTGYSSLAYLWRFPFDKVKIDRAFTQHLGDDGRVDLIVGSIVSLAHSLDIRVNAEGVETEAQRNALRDHGCDELQGFLLGRPMPRERLAHDEPVAAQAAATSTPACS